MEDCGDTVDRDWSWRLDGRTGEVSEVVIIVQQGGRLGLTQLRLYQRNLRHEVQAEGG